MRARSTIGRVLLLAILTIPSSLEGYTTQYQDPYEVMTLVEAVEIARTRHPRTEIAAAHLTITRGMTRTEGAFSNPTAEWQVEGLSSDGLLETDRFLTATLPIDLFGSRLARRASGRATIRSAEAEALSISRQVELDAAASYWRAALAQALYDAESEQRSALEELARYDEVRYREGAIAEVDALRTRLEADRARITEAIARTELAEARAELAIALGLDTDEIPRLEPLIVEPMKAAWRTPSLEEALESARSRRPELQAANSALDAARLQRTAARLGSLPQPDLIGGMKRTNGATGAVIGVSLPIPLFDRNQGEREVATGELRRAEAHRRAVEAMITTEVTAAVETLEALLDALGPDEWDLGARGREMTEIMENAYREGGATLVELLETRRAAIEAQISALRWHAELRIALLQLNYLTGAPLLEGLP